MLPPSLPRAAAVRRDGLDAALVVGEPRALRGLS
jgi:hypothetical protein